MLICLSSARGSVGVSSWALLLGGAWPGARERVVIEADVAGGTAAVRYGLAPDPGVASLLFDCRLGSNGTVDPARHGRRLGERLWCVPGPESAEQAFPIWAAGAEALAELISADDRIWLLDCGRLAPSGPMEPLVRAATVNLVLADRSDETMVALPDRVRHLTATGPGTVVIAVVGRTGRSVDEVRAFTGCPQVWELPTSRRLVDVVADGLRPRTGRLSPGRRSTLWRAATSRAAALADLDGPSSLNPDRGSRPVVAGRGAVAVAVAGHAGEGEGEMEAETLREPAGGLAVQPGNDRIALRPPDPPSWTYWHPADRAEVGGVDPRCGASGNRRERNPVPERPEGLADV